MFYFTTIFRKDFVLFIKFDCVNMFKTKTLMKKLKKFRNTFALQISFIFLNLFTKTFSKIVLNIEFIFVINRFEFMKVEKFAFLKQILSFFIQFLQQITNCMFNICFFELTFEMF